MADGRDIAIEKGLIVQSTTKPANAFETKKDDEAFRGSVNCVTPPYDPEVLWRIAERSALLRPCVDAWATNIVAHGHHLEPEIDPEAEDAEKRIVRSLILEKLEDGLRPIVSPDDIAARRAEIEVEADVEHERLTMWFRRCAVGMTFLELCMRTIRSREYTGSAFWEILRDKSGEPARINFLPATGMRLLPYDAEETEIQVPIKVSTVSYRLFREKRRLRLYVQLHYGIQAVYFKTLGDTRIISSRTGRVYTSFDDLRVHEGADTKPATEVYHFDQLSTDLTDYGVPRWIGALLAVLGSREAEEANYLFFANNAVPEGMLLFSGGAKPAADAALQVENYLRDRKGNEVRWKPLIITAAEGGAGGAASMQGGASAPKSRVQWVPLRDGSGADALFQNYEAVNAKKVQQQFRLPDLLVGKSEETNRAQADAVIEMAEQQVFGPERAIFDAVMDRIFAEKGVRYWRFCLNGPKQGDSSQTVEMVVKLATVGILTPAEARDIVGPAFGRAFDREDRPDRRMALAWLQAGMAVPPSSAELEAQKAAALDAGTDTTEARPRPQLTPSSNEKIITVDEARVALGYKPFGDARGKMTLSELDKGVEAGPKPGAGLAETVKSLVDVRSVVKAAREAVEKEALDDARKAASRAEPETIEVPVETFNSWFKQPEKA